MPLFIVTVTEAPRVGQRTPRVSNWAVTAKTSELAIQHFKHSIPGEAYGQGPDDTVTAEAQPDSHRPLRLNF